MNKNSKIYVAGHGGLVGSALVRKLESEGYVSLLRRTHSELDLTDQIAVAMFFKEERPDYVFLAAARVGGILANNNYPAEFIYENLAIQNNVIHQAYLHNVKRLLFLGSSCIYPRECPQPIKEEYLLTGPLESTNEPYAIAKIAGVKMCWAYNLQYGTRFFCVMPTNLYGQNDNFDLETSHVIPALIRKFYDAKKRNLPSVLLWGSGNPRREFFYADDLADACLFLMNLSDEDFDVVLNKPWGPLMNVGCGEDLTIKELALLIKNIIKYKGKIMWDESKPDGTPRKLLDISRWLSIRRRLSVSLQSGLEETCLWYSKNHMG